VEEGSPAAGAGLRGLRRTNSGFAPGDVILSVAGERVRSVGDLFGVLEAREAGDTVTLELWRDGATREVELTLAPRA